MPAARKVSVLQLDVLVSHMEEHTALAKGQSLDTPQAKAAVRKQWEELAAKLNAIMGHQKTGGQWREEENPLPALPSLPLEVEVCSPAVDAPAPLVLPAPLLRPPACQPSTSRAPLVEGSPSAAAGDAPASKRKRRADATATAANAAEIPHPRWAWEAEQNRLALDQRRLEADERKVALFERAVQLFETSVAAQESAAATLVQIKDSLKALADHLVDRL